MVLEEAVQDGKFVKIGSIVDTTAAADRQVQIREGGQVVRRCEGIGDRVIAATNVVGSGGGGGSQGR